MTSNRNGTLPWSLAFDRPEDAPPLFHDAVAHALAGVGPETVGTFALIPNFRFNHTGYRPNEVEDLYLGRLTVSQDGSVSATQHDTTSGEHWALTVRGPRLLGVGADWEVQATTNDNAMRFAGKVEPAGDDMVLLSQLGRSTRQLARVPQGRPVLHRPTLFLGLADLADAEFDLIDLTHGYEPNLRTHRVDSTEQLVGNKLTALECFVVAGPRSIPTYWWADESGRVVAMSGTLWTYVLTPPESLA